MSNPLDHEDLDDVCVKKLNLLLNQRSRVKKKGLALSPVGEKGQGSVEKDQNHLIIQDKC